MVGIFVKSKPPERQDSGDKKTAQAASHLPRAPDAESEQYRNKNHRRKNILRLPNLSF
jgi:hypothetical protein